MVTDQKQRMRNQDQATEDQDHGLNISESIRLIL